MKQISLGVLFFSVLIISPINSMEGPLDPSAIVLEHKETNLAFPHPLEDDTTILIPQGLAEFVFSTLNRLAPHLLSELYRACHEDDYVVADEYRHLLGVHGFIDEETGELASNTEVAIIFVGITLKNDCYTSVLLSELLASGVVEEVESADAE